MDFYSPTRIGESEISEKRSRFIGRVFHVGDAEEARRAIDDVRSKRRDARHNPWCYILTDGAERASDDGEPSGTSGPPMLEMLRHENVRGAAVVVTRYFGGVLLGPGGLARAYTAAAKAALEDSRPRLYTTKTLVGFTCSYSLAAQLRHEISNCGGAEHSAEYGEAVTVSALFDFDNAERFCRNLKDITAGAVIPDIKGELAVPAE